MILKGRHSTWSIVVILILSLIVFLGCPSGGGTDPEPEYTPPAYTPPPYQRPTQAEKDASALADELGPNVSVIGNTASINGPVTLPAGSNTIKPGVTLDVKPTYTLTVPNSAIMTVTPTATVTVKGILTQAGEVNNEGTIEVPTGGVYNITNAGTSGTNNGTITIKAGGAIKAGGSNLVNGTGLHVVEVGGEAYYNDVVLVGYSGSTSPIITLANGSFSWNNEQYNLNGDATLNSAFRFAGTSETLTLKILSGKTLTIKNSLLGSIAGQKIDNTEGTITIGDGGTNNFYGGSDSESPGSYIYIWTANVGGSGSAGWVRPASD
jgi:hypothetical protein